MEDWEAPTYTISMKQITNEDLLRVDMQELSMSKFLGRNHRPIYLGVYLFFFLCLMFFLCLIFSNRELYSVICGELTGKETQKRRDTCICITDSLCCTAEIQ